MLADVERDLMPLLIRPEGRLTSISMRVRGSLRDLAELLAELHEALSRHGPPPYVFEVRGREGDCFTLLYVDGLPPSALNELRGLASRRGVEVEVEEGPYRGICFHPRRGELLAAGIPVMIFSKSLMLDLIRELKGRWGSAAESFLYYFGHGGGVRTYRRWRRMLSWLSDYELLDAICRVVQAFGWYTGYKIVDFDRARGEARIDVYDLFECLESDGGSVFYRGILAGWFTACLGGEVDVVEERCLSRGDRLCRFYVRLRRPSTAHSTL